MSTAKSLVTAAAAILIWMNTVYAQGQSPQDRIRSTIPVTSAATADRVRFTAPSTVVQIRLEVYDPNGKKLFDNEIRGGNVIDWHLQNGHAEPLPDSSYLCVVTVKSISGRNTQRIGSAKIEQGTATLESAVASQLTPQQTQAVGPIEDDVSLTVLTEDQNQTSTVIAHNGEDGQITRGRGGLSFRIGDFFSGKDVEQMRLTAEGNLGIGLTHPQVKLDVDGLIRTGRGIVFPDGSVQLSAARKTLGAASLEPGQSQQKLQAQQQAEAAPDTSGTGTTGKIPKWSDGPNGVLDDSNITEATGAIGINGTPDTRFRLDVNGSTRIRGSNPGFNLEGLRSAGNIWLFQTVDDDGRFRLFGQDNVNPGVERFTINLSTGNVGIGATSPSSKLEIGGNALVYPASGPGSLHIRNRTINDFSQVVFDDHANVYRGYIGYIGASAGLGARNNTVEFGTQFNDMTFRPNEVEAMRIATTGRVGIGVPNPTQKLHVSGTGVVRALVNSDSNAGLAVGLGGAMKWSVATVDPGTFQIFNEANAQNALMIDGSSNNVGIGTPPTPARLAVVTPLANGIYVNAAALGGIVAEFGSSGAFHVDSTAGVGGRLSIGEDSTVLINNPQNGQVSAPEVRLIVNGAVKAHFGVGGTLPLCSNQLNDIAFCSSSLRYKENVNDFSLGFDLIKRLRPVSFNWKAGGMADMGLIAEEVERVEPLLVTHNNQGEIEGVKYDRVAVVLLNAVKEQQAQIKKQTEMIQRQQSELHTQGQLIKQQQSQLASLKRVVCKSHPKARTCQ